MRCKIINFIIKGKAKAKQSVKFTSKGIKYTPADIKEYANWVKLSFINAYPNWNIETFKDKPLKVQIDVFSLIPKSWSKKKQIQALKGNLRPITKPDCDNLAKNINDALNGLLWADDKQIVSLTVNKHYSNEEYAKITVVESP